MELQDNHPRSLIEKINNMKKYKVTFTTDFTKYEKSINDYNELLNNYTEYEKFINEKKDHYIKGVMDYYLGELETHPKQLAICKKWKDKEVALSELPEFIAEVGDVILSKNEVEVYNDNRE